MPRSGATGARGPNNWARLRSHEITVTTATWTRLAVAVGMILRILEYVDNRPLYKDEQSLLDNLVRLPALDFHTTLSEFQLAPPGFLVLERLMVRLPGSIVANARLFPLACGIAAMVLFPWVARRYLSHYAVPIATALFALADWLIYYASEIKQYSCDLVLALAALSLVADPKPAAGREPGAAALSPKRLLALAGTGAIGVWFSYPLAFVLAGTGTYLITVTAVRRNWRETLHVAAVGIAWIASFAACYTISHRILSKEPFIWNWWHFAFLPLPPRSLTELNRDFWHVLNVFDSPASVLTPLGVLPSAFLALGLFLCGCVALARTWPGGVYLLLAPILFSLIASALHQYPFHGRLLIFLVPSVHMLVGEGAAALTRRGGSWLTIALAAFLLLQPASDIVWHRLVQRHEHGAFDSHGDLRPDLLDYLERLEATPRRRRATP
jgi:hypothetical protein